MSIIKSTYDSQCEILAAIRTLHCPDGFDADLTFGNGGFWKSMPRPARCFDLSPLAEGVEHGDSTMLPLEPGTLRSAVFDPPFMTYIRDGRAHKGGNMRLSARFGGYWTYDELEDHYRHTISECYRVLAPRGVLVFKCQDIVHNHRLHCTHARVISMAETEGFRLADLFVLTAKHRMPSPQKGQQRHARIHHSYFLVLQRDGATFGKQEAA